MKSVGYFKDRLQNLYLTYLVCLRAVTKLAPFLTKYPYNSKVKEESLTIQVLSSPFSSQLYCVP